MNSDHRRSDLKSFLVALAKSRFLWSGLAAYSVYWLMTLLFPSEPLLNASSVLVLIGGLAIFVSWFPSFLMGVITGARIGSWQLPVGVVLTWMGISEQRTWTLIWRLVGQPDWMLNHHFIGQANWVIFLSSVLYIISPGNETGEVPVKNWWVLGVALGLAGAAAGSVLTALILQS